MSRCFVYILQCSDGSLYTGWTNDVSHRVSAHNAGTGAKYTKSRRPVIPVYSEELPSKPDALRREAEIKKLTRAKKLELIASQSLK